MWQKCPVCSGSGRVDNFTSSLATISCHVCNGKGIISELTGLPPGDFNPVDRDGNSSSDKLALYRQYPFTQDEAYPVPKEQLKFTFEDTTTQTD
jgi:hypothetical protein